MSTQNTPATTSPATRTMSGAELLAELDRLRAENAASKAALAAAQQTRASGPGVTLKVSAKGAVSAYGLGRWPVTLYSDQWTRLIAKVDDIRAFIEANQGALAQKPRD